MQIDAVDQRIIALLVADARASYADIGTRVSLSAPAVKRRVDRLRATGVIRGFTAVVDPAAVGWTTEAFVELFCAGRTTPAQIGVAARRHPEVVGAYTVSGEADALVHLRAADIAHLEAALERLRAESVRHVHPQHDRAVPAGRVPRCRTVQRHPLRGTCRCGARDSSRRPGLSPSPKNRLPPNSPCSRSSSSSARPVITCTASMRWVAWKLRPKTGIDAQTVSSAQ